MSDHIDGPRQIGDPAGDLTDLFAFTSPENPARTVLAACLFPSAGADAMFSNAVGCSIALRRVSVAGLGDAAQFKTGDQEIRFSCRFDLLERAQPGAKPVQRGSISLPDGQTLRLVVNDKSGASTPDGVFRVFAGLRSDPFYLAWIMIPRMRAIPNILQHDNVLCIVIEFDTRRVLDPDKGSLFGAIAETLPLARTSPVGPPPLRLDWVGRPEQTNVRLNYGPDLEDIRDLWNQQTPFAIASEHRDTFLRRLHASLAHYDMLDGTQDWTGPALAANANVFLDDYLILDVAKPITDTSHLEIERSTLNGRAYETGGGRTVDANVIDILMTWLVNRDRAFLQGGAKQATKPGMKTFPYFADPNTELQDIADSVDLEAAPDRVWTLVGQFDPAWHPLVANVRMVGSGIGQLRVIETIDGKQIVERLEAIDDSTRTYRYSNISGIPASNYTGILAVKPRGSGSSVVWSARFLPDNQPDIVVRAIVSTLFKTGLSSLKSRFGEAR
jgi:hypothetical protein